MTTSTRLHHSLSRYHVITMTTSTRFHHSSSHHITSSYYVAHSSAPGNGSSSGSSSSNGVAVYSTVVAVVFFGFVIVAIAITIVLIIKKQKCIRQSQQNSGIALATPLLHACDTYPSAPQRTPVSNKSYHPVYAQKPGPQIFTNEATLELASPHIAPTGSTSNPSVSPDDDKPTGDGEDALDVSTNHQSKILPPDVASTVSTT